MHSLHLLYKWMQLENVKPVSRSSYSTISFHFNSGRIPVRLQLNHLTKKKRLPDVEWEAMHKILEYISHCTRATIEFVCVYPVNDICFFFGWMEIYCNRRPNASIKNELERSWMRLFYCTHFIGGCSLCLETRENTHTRVFDLIQWSGALAQNIIFLYFEH